MLKIIENFLTIEGFSIVKKINIEFFKKPFEIFEIPDHRKKITNILNEHKYLDEYLYNYSCYGLRWLNIVIEPVNSLLLTSNLSILQYDEDEYLLLLANINETSGELSIKAKVYQDIQSIYQNIADDLELVNSNYLINKFFNK